MAVTSCSSISSAPTRDAVAVEAAGTGAVAGSGLLVSVAVVVAAVGRSSS